MSRHLSIALVLFPRYIHVRIPHKYVRVLFHFEIEIIGNRMLRNTFICANSLLRNAVNKQSVAAPMVARSMSKVNTETDDQFDNRYETYFARHDIDGWEVRKGMNDLCGMDLVPEPKIVVAALKACRRVNDYALAVRFIEAVKDKCGSKVGEIYPYILNEIRPTLGELGIDTPEELGYDKPELALEATN